MPHEKINHPREQAGDKPPQQLVIGWNPIGWVQASIYPEGWSNTGDAVHVDLNAQELDLLIATLKRARRKAYDSGQRHAGFEDGPKIKSAPLFNE